jgi:hypothetical protein
MPRSAISLLVLFLVIRLDVALAQTKHDSRVSSGTGYSNAALGFRYMPPGEMLDKTERTRSDIQAQANSLHTDNTLNIILAMSSGPDDTANGWHSLSIETYPRKAVANLDDASAKAKMSAWVANSTGASVLPRSVILSGQNFSVSLFGAQEGTIRKGAVVWTTVRKGKLLSFAFSANSPEQLKVLAESMKSLQFF